MSFLEREEDRQQAYVDVLDRIALHRNRDADAFERVWRCGVNLKDWYRERCGWRFRSGGAFRRLEKLPASRREGHTRGWAKKRVDYEILAWVFWYLERMRGNRFIISEMADDIAAQAESASGATALDWSKYWQRLAMVRALEHLLEVGVLELEDGSASDWSRGEGKEDALFECTELLYLFTPAISPAEVRHRLGIEGDEEPEQAPPEKRLYRALLLGLGLHRAVDPEAFQILEGPAERHRVRRDIKEHLGWDLEVTSGYACLLRPRGSRVVGAEVYPPSGCDGDVLLLLIGRLRELVAEGGVGRPDRHDRLRLSRTRLRLVLDRLGEEHGQKWTVQLGRDMGSEQLTRHTIELLRDLGLLEEQAGNMVYLLPLAARMTGHYAESDPERGPGDQGNGHPRQSQLPLGDRPNEGKST